MLRRHSLRQLDSGERAAWAASESTPRAAPKRAATRTEGARGALGYRISKLGTSENASLDIVGHNALFGVGHPGNRLYPHRVVYSVNGTEGSHSRLTGLQLQQFFLGHRQQDQHFVGGTQGKRRGTRSDAVPRLDVHVLDNGVKGRGHRKVSEGCASFLQGDFGQAHVLSLLPYRIFGGPRHQIIVLGLSAGQAGLGSLKRGLRLFHLPLIRSGAQFLQPSHGCSVAGLSGLQRLLCLVHVSLVCRSLQILDPCHRCRMTGSRRVQLLLSLGNFSRVRRGAQFIETGHSSGVAGARRLQVLLCLVHVVLGNGLEHIGKVLFCRCQRRVSGIPVCRSSDQGHVGVDQCSPKALINVRPVLERVP